MFWEVVSQRHRNWGSARARGLWGPPSLEEEEEEGEGEGEGEEEEEIGPQRGAFVAWDVGSCMRFGRAEGKETDPASAGSRGEFL